jgi:hypothetical protein
MIALLLLACDGFGGGTSPTDVVAVTVEPAQATLVVTDGVFEQVQFSAQAELRNGDVLPLELVSWASSNLSAGQVDADGLFTSVDTNGGVTTVSASHLGIQGDATITVIYTLDVFEEGTDAAMAAAFAASEPADGGPEMVYPPDGVAVPRNLEGLGFRWDNLGSDVYRVRLRSEITDISVYITQATWISDSALWQLISASNRGGQVEVTVESASWDGATLSNHTAGGPLELVVNRLDARGSLYYWAADQEGIMRIPFGETDAQVFWRGREGRACVGCHDVTQVDGQDRMVVTHDGINGVFSLVDISNPDNPKELYGPRDNERFTFKTVSPDGSLIMGSVLGELVLYDTETGGFIKNLTPPGDGYYVQPSWSPDGDAVVMVQVSEGSKQDFFFEKGELVLFEWDAETKTLGDSFTLVERGDLNNYYPAFSPDGGWIAFNRAPGPAYANPRAALWLVSVDGSTLISLDTANGDGEFMQNSYPRWGPLPDDDVLWLAYSSKRSYPINDRGQPQIWVTAIDERLAEQGEDPSSAPFWLPGQTAGSDNHLPVWWKN